MHDHSSLRVYNVLAFRHVPSRSHPASSYLLPETPSTPSTTTTTMLALSSITLAAYASSMTASDSTSMVTSDSITSVGGHLFSSTSFGTSFETSTSIALLAYDPYAGPLDALMDIHHAVDTMTTELGGSLSMSASYASSHDDTTYTLAAPLRIFGACKLPTVITAAPATFMGEPGQLAVSAAALATSDSITCVGGHLFASTSFATSFASSASLADFATADICLRVQDAVVANTPSVVTDLLTHASLRAEICNLHLGVPSALPSAWRRSTPVLRRSPASRRTPSSWRSTPPSARSHLSTPALSSSSSSRASTPLSALDDASIPFRRVSGMRMPPAQAWNEMMEDDCDAVLDAFYFHPAPPPPAPTPSAPTTKTSVRKNLLGACRRAFSRLSLSQWNNMPASAFA